MDPVTAQQLVNKVAALESQVAMLEQRLLGRPKARLPDPEKFTGAARYDTWLPLIKAKLRIDADAIGNDEAQFFYLYGNLDSKIQAMVLPQLLQAEDNGVWDFQTILDQLERVFDDPTKRDTAAARLQGIRQGSDSLPVYLSKFERLLHEANANSWPDDSKVAILRNGVNDKLKAKLDVQLELPTKYEKFVKALHKLGGHGGSGQGNSSGNLSSGQGKPLGSLSKTPRIGEPMDLSAADLREDETFRVSGMRVGGSVRFAPSSTPAQRQAGA